MVHPSLTPKSTPGRRRCATKWRNYHWTTALIDTLGSEPAKFDSRKDRESTSVRIVRPWTLRRIERSRRSSCWICGMVSVLTQTAIRQTTQLILSC